MAIATRREQLQQWLAVVFPNSSLQLTQLNGDAGFRCYYRLQRDDKYHIVVDAPPDKVNNLAFVEMADAFAKQNLCVPEIIAYQASLGFMCLEDFGDTLLADKLTTTTMDSLYQQALLLLPKVAQVESSKLWSLPVYDRALLQLELDIFKDWLVGAHLCLELDNNELEQLQDCFDVLVNSALEQPRVTVHRDFHSRNLMLLDNGEIGVIDFQDAVQGPITYDLVSLLRDCYVRWDDQQVDDLRKQYLQQLTVHRPEFNLDELTFSRWFDLMGLQRHIKAAGIFARLYHRDGKAGYLADIPLTLTYIIDIAGKYPALQFLSQLVKNKVLPALQNQAVELTP